MPEYPCATITLKRPTQHRVGREISLRYEIVAEGLRCELYPTGVEREPTPLGLVTCRHAVALLSPRVEARVGDRIIAADGATYEVTDTVTSDIAVRCELREAE